MKSNIIIILIISCLLLASCFSPYTGTFEDKDNSGESYGTVTISIGGGSRAALPWNPSTDSNDLEHFITLTDSKGKEQNKTLPAGGGSTGFSLVAVGSCDIYIVGVHSGIPKSEGRETVMINPGPNGPFAIQMGPSPINISPSSATVKIGKSQQFSISSGESVNWTIENSSVPLQGGTFIDSSGLLFIDPGETVSATLTIRADSVVTNPSRSATASVMVSDLDNAISPSLSGIITVPVSYVINDPASPINVTVTNFPAITAQHSEQGGGSISIQWYSSNINPGFPPSGSTLGAPITGSGSDSYTPPTSSAGTTYYWVEVTNSIDDNLDGGNKTVIEVSNVVMVLVTLAIPDITSWPTAATVTYGTQLSFSALSGGVSVTPGSFAWTTGTTIAPVSNFGYSVTFTPADPSTYEPVTQIVPITVNPKALANAAISVTGTFTYTGSAHQPTNFSNDGGLMTTSDRTITNYGPNTDAGNGTVTILGSGNYTGTRTLNFTIGRAAFPSGTTPDHSTNYPWTGPFPVINFQIINPSPPVVINGETINLEYAWSLTQGQTEGLPWQSSNTFSIDFTGVTVPSGSFIYAYVRYAQSTNYEASVYTYGSFGAIN